MMLGDKMVRIRVVEIRDENWRQQDVGVQRRTRMSENDIQIVINNTDVYINDLYYLSKSRKSLYQFFKLEDIKASIEHIKTLTDDKEKYQGANLWDNVKGMYIHPFLALKMVAINIRTRILTIEL